MAETNKDFKQILFGEKKREATGSDEEPTSNFLNGKNFSDKFYKLLETRKSLPAWAAKQKLIELVK